MLAEVVEEHSRLSATEITKVLLEVPLKVRSQARFITFEGVSD